MRAPLLAVLVSALVVLVDSQPGCRSVKFKLKRYKRQLERELCDCERVKNGESEEYTPAANIDEILKFIEDNCNCDKYGWFHAWMYGITNAVEKLRTCRDVVVSAPPVDCKTGGPGASCIFDAAGCTASQGEIRDAVCADETKVCCVL